jgi:hypothetical protein
VQRRDEDLTMFRFGHSLVAVMAVVVVVAVGCRKTAGCLFFGPEGCW